MRQILIASFIVTALILAGCGDNENQNTTDQSAKELQDKAKALFGPLPDKMPGSEKDTKERIALGKALYFDKRLSINDTQSCNSCHMIDDNKGGVDNLPTSPGAIEGRGGERNSPTVLNAGFHLAQFWDGREKDLQSQAKGPILNQVEMAMPNAEAVVNKISGIQEYKDMFGKAFPGEENPITYDNLGGAIAAFERTLITHDRFDKFMKGDSKALTEAELKGLKLFIDIGCTSCHMQPTMGGDIYRKMGVHKPYKNTKDLGRFAVTNKDEDKYVFKVPSLRNITITAPYFHDGAVATLEEAVALMAEIQLDKKLSDDQVKSIVTFLKTLTDEARAK